MLPQGIDEFYRAFYHSARQNEILPPKVTLMIHLASAMAFGCYP